MRRRSVLLAAVSGALTGALTLGRSSGVAARQEPSSLAEHPLTGTWLAMVPVTPGAPLVPIPSLFTADGQVVLAWPVTQVGAQGVTFASSVVGTWEADSERRGHFTAVQVLSDANGVFTGTVTTDGHPAVGEDGQTFTDDAPETKLTVRDPAGNIVMVVGGDGSFPPVTGIRMAPGAPGFPDGGSASTPMAGTPTS